MTYTYTYTAAELQQHHDTVADGESNGFAIAPNLIKISRLVVEGVDGEPLPTNGVNTNYLAGVEVAFGCTAGTDITNLTNDTAGDIGDWTATSGTIFYEVDIGPGRTISNYFGSVIQADGTQLYAGSPGVTLTENSGKARLTVDFAQVSFSAWGISEQRGLFEMLSTEGVINAAQSELLNARTYKDLTASRAANVVYTNDSSTDIEIFIRGVHNAGQLGGISVSIDGGLIRGDRVFGSGTQVTSTSMSITIKRGSTYEFIPLNDASLSEWHELRI